jgi:hypothetical protein
MRGMKTDPARFEVVKNALYSAAEEMKTALGSPWAHYQPAIRLTLLVMARRVRASEHASEGTYSHTCRDRWPGHLSRMSPV